MKQLLSLALVLVLVMPLVQAQAGPIAYVDMQAVLDRSKAGQKARGALKEKFAGRQEELAKEEQAIRQMQQELAREQALMSQAMLDKKNAEIKERIAAFEQKASAAQREFVQEQTKLGNQILEPAQALITVLAKEKRVGAIFERRQSGLLYVDESLDLTDEVIKRLDAKQKEPPAATRRGDWSRGFCYHWAST